MFENVNQDSRAAEADSHPDERQESQPDQMQDLRWILQQIRNYQYAGEEAREESLRGVQAGMMRVSAVLEKKLVECLSAPGPATPEQLEKSRLPIHTYVGLNKQIQQYQSYIARSRSPGSKAATPPRGGAAAGAEDAGAG